MDFIKEVLENTETFGGFKITKYSQSEFDKKENDIWYGKAHDRIGLTIITWSTNGHSMNYFGDPLKDNIGVGIQKDGGTRYVFNGICYNKEDFLKVLELTW